MIKKITAGKTLLALVLDTKDIGEGITAVTDPAGSLQLLMRKNKKGTAVAMHKHKKMPRTIERIQEGLVVMKGEVKATIADRRGKVVGTYKVTAGQCLFLANGAHRVEITKNAVIYEFKTGPYRDDKVLVK